MSLLRSYCDALTQIIKEMKCLVLILKRGPIMILHRIPKQLERATMYVHMTYCDLKHTLRVMSFGRGLYLEMIQPEQTSLTPNAEPQEKS